MASDKELKISIKTAADLAAAKQVPELLDEISDKAKEAADALDVSVPTEIVPPDTADNAAEAEKALARLSDEEERLLKLKSQFLTAAEAEVAEIERLAEAAQREAAARAAVEDAARRSNDAIHDSTAAANLNAKSIDQLEEELRQLQREFAKLPVGGREFVMLAGRVKEAESALVKAEAEARRLGGTMSRRGNAGMAVLEFSRAFEDAQYGMRGVLNNIPGLIQMLGGGAGLAGIISVVAVGANLLFEKLSSGPAAAKEPLDDYNKSLEETKTVYEEIEKISQKQRDDAVRDAARQRETALGIINFESQLASRKDANERLQIQANGRLAIAKQQLEIARLESELSGKSGAEALRLTEARKAAMEKIRDIEMQVTEELRAQDEAIARRAVTEAIDRKKVATNESERASDVSLPLQQELERLEKERAEVMARRIKAEEDLAIAIENAAKEMEFNAFGGSDVVSANEMIAQQEVKSLRVRIANIEKELGSIDAAIETKTPGAEKARDESLSAVEVVQKADETLKLAIDALEQVKKANEINRGTEKDIRDIDGQRQNMEDVRKAGKDAADNLSRTLEDILGQLGDAANKPSVQAGANRLRQILEDGFQVNEQGEVANILLRIAGELKRGSDASVQATERILQTVEVSVLAVQNLATRINRLELGLQGVFR